MTAFPLDLIYVVSAGGIISLIALLSAFVIASRHLSRGATMILVAIAAGTMLSTAWLHFLPEAVHELPVDLTFQLLLGSFVTFFILEKVLHWHHCHKPDCHEHSFGVMNLLGDSLHNFIDGLIIAAAFMVDVNLGIITTIAVSLHEIPQEIGDLGVILLAGYSKKQAILLNFSVALTVVVGGLAGYLLGHNIHQFSIYLLPIAAGGFTYLAATDLVPQMHHTKSARKSLLLIFMFVMGILLNPLTQQLLPQLSHLH